jgi:hypothetical protein
MTTPAAIWPCPGCPARHGNGTDVSVADFILVVEDCERSPARYPISTEIFGYFRLPGAAHDNDAVLTAGLLVPVGSPIAQLAHHISADPVGALTGRVRDALRANVALCAGQPCHECPALDEVRLLGAMEHATR